MELMEMVIGTVWTREQSARDCGFPPLCKRDLRCTGMLRIVDWQLTTFRYKLSFTYVRVKQPFLYIVHSPTNALFIKLGKV